MRVTLLSCLILAFTATTASAQYRVGPWNPRPTLGVGLGGFGAVGPDTAASALLSGTCEIPFSRHGRIRLEGARSALPIVPEGAPDSTFRRDTAHIERLTISAAGVREPGAFVSGYIGGGVGFYRATFDYAPKSGVKADLYVHGGAELHLKDRLTLDAELALHGFREDPWFHRNLITGETVFRLKVGL